MNRRTLITTACSIGLASLAGCQTSSGPTPTPSGSSANYTDEHTEISNLHILDGPTPGGLKVGFTIRETGGVEKTATPELRFYDVAGEEVLPQVPSIELEPNETREWSMGFLIGVGEPHALDLQPGDTLLVSVEDEVVTATVQEESG